MTGFPKRWVKTVNIKPYITEDDSDEAAQKASQGIAALLRAKLPEYDYTDFIEECETADDLNYELKQLYDYADEKCIWLGLK